MFAISQRKTSLFTLTLATFLLFGGVAQARTTLDGKIRIENTRMDTVSVRIDGERLGRIGPGASRLFGHVPNGVRLVQINGPGSAVNVSRVAVPIHATARYRVTPIKGLALIRNRSEVAVRVTLNGKLVGTIAANRSLETNRMRPGKYTLVAKPTRFAFHHAPALRQSLIIKAGQRAEVSLGPWYASVTVANPFHDQIQLYIDGQRVMHIPAHESVTLARQIPGVHEYTLRRRGRVFSRIEMRLQSGRSAAWRPVSDRGGLIKVSNRTGGQLKIFVDGRYMASVFSGAQKLIRDVHSGTHTVLLKTPRGRVVETQRVRVRAAHTAEVIAAATHHQHHHPRRSPQPLAMR